MATTSGERTHASGQINVRKYEPSTYDQPAGGPALVRIHVEEDFSGDIEGSGVAEFLQTARSESEASFVGVERVTGRVGGQAGTFVLQDAGTLTGGTVSGSWFVVPGSGTGELQGLRGEGGFTAALGQSADITLDYWFEGGEGSTARSRSSAALAPPASSHRRSHGCHRARAVALVASALDVADFAEVRDRVLLVTRWRVPRRTASENPGTQRPDDDEWVPG